jgi:plastocyanin
MSRTLRVCSFLLAAATAGPAAAYQATTVKDGGSIAGMVSYAGEPPARRTIALRKDQEVCGTEQADPSLVVGPRKEIADAVVEIVGISKGKPFPDEPPVLDQKRCTYVPHVLVAPAGVDIRVRNSDGILHNVHTRSTANAPVNLAQPGFRKETTIALEAPETVTVKCDTHEWMSGVILVTDHPYVTTSDEKGSFRLADVPPGEYEVRAWHERLGEKRAKVKVEAGKESRVDFSLGAK